MATQANITLTALPHQHEPLPDIPLRKMTLNYGGPAIILGRASLKEPKESRDGHAEKKNVSRLAAVNNGYMSRNETIASNHAALFLRRDGELCLEHRAGRFPPTFVNGNQVLDCVVPVENNDIINLGPLRPYTSKHKDRTYHPFAIKLNFTYDYKVLTADNSFSSSSSSLSDDDDRVLPMATTSQREKLTPRDPPRKHEVIDVSSCEEDVSSFEEDASSSFDIAAVVRSIISLPANQHQPIKTKTETVIIDLTENELDHGGQARLQHSKSSQVAYAEYELSSDYDEYDGHEKTGDAEEMDTDEMQDDSIFGDDASNAPSEEPIERSHASGPFSRGFRLDYSPEPELFTSDKNVAPGSDDQSDDEEELDRGEPSTTSLKDHGPHPSLSEEFRNFQESDRLHIIQEAERKSDEEQRQERQALHDTCMDTQEDEVLASRIDEDSEALQQHVSMSQRAFAFMMGIKSAKRSRHAKRHAHQREALDRSAELIPPLPRFDKVASEVLSVTSSATKSHTQSSAVSQEDSPASGQIEFRSSPPLIQPNNQIPALPIANPVLNNADMDIFGTDNCCVMPPTPTPANNPLPEQKRWPRSCSGGTAYIGGPSEYFAARAANRAIMLNNFSRDSSQDQPRQGTPPSLLMSGSLFGQPLEAGITLPAVGPHTLRDEFGNLKEEMQIGAQKLWYDEQTKQWMGRHRGKVSISDLVQHVEDEYNEDEDEYNEDEDEDNAAWDAAKAKVEKQTQTDTDAMQDVHVSAKATNTAVVSEKGIERSAEVWATKAGEEPTAILMTHDELDPPATKSESPSKKRKHVEFEENDTIIFPTPTSADDASGSATSLAAYDVLMTEASRTAALAVEVRDRMMNYLIEEQRRIATPVAPSSRLKRVVERAAFATMGGVVAAVGVFAALVATAPEDF